MLDPTTVTMVMGAELVLYISVHLYMDLRMFRSHHRKSRSSAEFTLSVVTQMLAFLPSVVFWIAFILSPWLVFSGTYEHFAVFPTSGGLGSGVQGVGLLLMFAAVILADWGRVSRGVIAPSVTMPEEYSLSTHGAYGVVRHPLYLSYDLFFVGLPLALLSPWLFGLLPGIYGYYRVACAEEKMLISRFGQEYKKYQQEVGMFIPYVGK